MSGIGPKLSRHVLGMKFMRKTKDQIDRSGNTNSSTAASGTHTSVKKETSNAIKTESNATPSSSIVEELWSYNQCERYIFGRQSFGGFNPAVEKNVRKGIWKPFYLDEGVNVNASSDEDEDTKKKQSDVDVSDEEMAKTYGSLIGTLAKRFKKKWKDDGNGKNLKGKSYEKQPKNKNHKKFNDAKQKNKFKGNQHQNSQGHKGSKYRDDDNDDGPTTSKRGHSYDDYEDGEIDMPPQKRRKFLKPSD